MRQLAMIAVFGISTASFGQTLVSAFDFNGTLNPYVDNNPPNVQPLEARTGGSPTSSTTPNFMMDTVNAVSKQVAVFAGPDFFRAWHGIGANGGGAYVNRYSVLMDVMHTKSSGDTSGWASFFNTTSDQGNDGDMWIQWSGEDAGGVYGTLGRGGAYAGKYYANRWNRVILSVDLTALTARFYVDGVLQNTVVTGGLDSGLSMYTYNDGDPAADHLDVLGDNDGDWTPGRISALGFFDGPLGDTEAAALGVAGDPVPEPATMSVMTLGVLALLRKRRKSA